MSSYRDYNLKVGVSFLDKVTGLQRLLVFSLTAHLIVKKVLAFQNVSTLEFQHPLSKIYDKAFLRK